MVFIGDEKFSIPQFRIVFKAVAKNKTKNGVYLRADKDVPYGIIAQLHGDHERQRSEQRGSGDPAGGDSLAWRLRRHRD